jgi:hypothetical protein
MAKKKELPVIPIKNNSLLNAFLIKTEEVSRVKAELETIRPDIDKLVMAIYNKIGLETQDRPENFTVLADDGTITAELKKKSKKQAISEDDLKFLKDKLITFNVEKTEVDYLLNPELKAKLLANPAHFHTLSWVNDKDGLPLIQRIEQTEVNVVADETIGEIYRWASNQKDLKTADLTTLIERYSTLAITPVYSGDEKNALYATRYLALAAPGEIYEHFKGGIYRILHRSTDGQGTEWVHYEHLWPHRHSTARRPTVEFFEAVERDGRVMRRFSFVKGDTNGNHDQG